MGIRIEIRQASLYCYMYKIFTLSLEVRDKRCFESKEEASRVGIKTAKKLGYGDIPIYFIHC